MIDFLVAAVAATLVLVGLAIIAGPDLPRLGRSVWRVLRLLRENMPSATPVKRPELRLAAANPSTERAINSAATAAALLRRQHHEDLGSRLATAARRLRSDEPAGLRSVLVMWPRLERVRVEDEASQASLDNLLHELHVAVLDRAEQLELLRG